jgi:hypothetical protein
VVQARFFLEQKSWSVAPKFPHAFSPELLRLLDSVTIGLKRALTLGIDKRPELGGHRKALPYNHRSISTLFQQKNIFPVNFGYITSTIFTYKLYSRTNKKTPAIASEQKGRGKMHHCLQFLPKNPFPTAFVFFAGDSKRGKR